jgi:hypothetical protein
MSQDTQKIDATLLNNLVGYRLRRAQLAYFENFTATCTEQGVTPGLFGILCVVRDNPGLTQTAVANAIDTSLSLEREGTVVSGCECHIFRLKDSARFIRERDGLCIGDVPDILDINLCDNGFSGAHRGIDALNLGIERCLSVDDQWE